MNPGALLLLPRSRLVLPLPEETPPGDRDAFAWGRYLNRDFLRLHPDGHSLLLVDAALEFMEGERRHLETFVFGLQAASSVQWQEWPGSLMDPQQEQSRQDLLPCCVPVPWLSTAWKPSTGHYQLRVLRAAAPGTPGRLAVSMALPLPQLPRVGP